MTEVTYKFLDKDLEFEYKDYGKWDRKIEGGDFVRVEGADSLITSVRFTLLTAYKELNTSPLFNNTGNKAVGLLKTLNNNIALVNMKAYFIEALDKNAKIKTVNNVTVTKTGANSVDVYINVTGMNDEDLKTNIRFTN